MSRTRRITALFRPYRRPLSTVLALIVLSAGLGIVSPFLLREVLDVALPERDKELLAGLVAGMIGISIATGVLGVGQTYLSNSVGQAVMHDLPNLMEHQVYACGAPIMVESAQRDFVVRCGLPDDEFYADSFTSEADKHGPLA